MALVTERLLEQLGSQVESHSVLVWYDPDETYREIVDQLTSERMAGAAIHRYRTEEGFVALRRELEPLWNGTMAPRLLVYVPLSRAKTHNALIEFEVAGVVVQPGQQPPERNTALAAVARRALASVFPPAALEEIVGQVEAGQLSLAELDQLGEKGVEAQTGAVALIFGSGNVSEVAIRFLADPAVDGEIEAKGALGSVAKLLSDALGVSLPVGQGPLGLRVQLARQVLVTDLIQALGKSVPQALRTFPIAEQAVARQAAVAMAQAWRNRRDLADSYRHWAGRVQTEIGLSSLELDLDGLARSETFATGESLLQALVETALAQGPAARLVELAEKRRGGFWSAQQPEIKTRWEVIANAGRVLVEAARIHSALKGKSGSAEVLFSSYAYGTSRSRGGKCRSRDGDEPWCELDTAQRHLERDFHRFDVEPHQHATLIQLVALARQRYADVANDLAERFSQAYASAKFELPGVMLQTDVYREVVAPAAQSGRVAYILVDALRFEMARELLNTLEPDWSHDLTPALATPPTVTEIGMAALMPGAEKGLAVAPGKSARLAAVVAGNTLETRRDRVNHLQTTLSKNVVVTKLDRLAPLSDGPLRKKLKSAALIVITATEEIDGLCESSPALARRMLDDVLNQLRRGLKTLFGLGVETAVISTDHGYLFGERLIPGQAIDAPGGKTVALKRRVWVGRGGAEQPGVLRAPLSAFGVGGELEIATPQNLSCFKVKGGATEYFHGGLSLQELVIPVLTVRPGAAPTPGVHAQIRWALTLGSHTISTRFVSVTVDGHSEELLPVKPPAVRVEVRAGEQTISVPVSAGYGFQDATRDVQLALDPDESRTIARNTVTLMITETPAVEEATLHLLDATTGLSLSRLEGVPLAITF